MKSLKKLITNLKKKISSPDALDETIKYKETKKDGGSAKVSSYGLGASVSYSGEAESEIEHLMDRLLAFGIIKL